MFIIWGAIQALYLIVEDLAGWDKKFVGNKISISFKKTFTYIVIAIGLVFFRLPSIKELGHMLNSLLSSNWTLFMGGSSNSAFIAIGVVILLVLEMMLDKKQMDQWIAEKHLVLRWGTYLSLMTVTLLIGVLDGQDFIYFQF